MTRPDFAALLERYPYVREYWRPGAQAGYVAGEDVHNPALWIIIHPEYPPYGVYPDTGVVVELPVSNGRPVVHWVGVNRDFTIGIGAVGGLTSWEPDPDMECLVIDMGAKKPSA